MKGKWTVRREQEGKKILDFLYGELGEERSKREIRRALERGQVIVNGRAQLRAAYPLRPGQKIAIQLDFFEMTMPSLAFDEKRLLYEDEHFIAYDKPAMVNSDADGILAIVRAHYPKAELVHRLDADTSGVLLLSRTAKAKEALEALFRGREIQKSYICIVDGVPKQAQGSIQNYLGKLEKRGGQLIWGEVSEAHGKQAETFWEMKKVGKAAALLVCRPTTGRTHQIRIHLADMGHPILGDHRYAKKFASAYYPCRHLLHARRLDFPHPFTEQRISITSDLPELFLEASKRLSLQRV